MTRKPLYWKGKLKTAQRSERDFSSTGRPAVGGQTQAAGRETQTPSAEPHRRARKIGKMGVARGTHEGKADRRRKDSAMTRSATVCLTAYNTGFQTEDEFDAWAAYVAARIDEVTGLDVSVLHLEFGHPGIAVVGDPDAPTERLFCDQRRVKLAKEPLEQPRGLRRQARRRLHLAVGRLQPRAHEALAPEIGGLRRLPGFVAETLFVEAGYNRATIRQAFYDLTSAKVGWLLRERAGLSVNDAGRQAFADEKALAAAEVNGRAARSWPESEYGEPVGDGHIVEPATGEGGGRSMS